ncbi:patatin-like phospholipase family protein [Psychrobacter sp. GP33]|uniref:patatin-like phospholipase family protein n=1 Tax=Psychrobacter sp. GP33 TaxID=2758709 RepID=UPI0015FA8E11|nr:patatin-like phospholipase family protein [Psychrobacter sp. GP33]
MNTQLRNLVFEGGGIKGLAYLGAMQVLEERKCLSGIKRVAGTSAGAINALIYALGYSLQEQREILENTDFKKFQDNSVLGVFDVNRLIHKFGWNKGDYFIKWIEGLIEVKLGKKRATFQDLINANKLEFYVTGSNLSTGHVEIFSAEDHPDMAISDALRISMAIPLYFTAVRYGERNDCYVDGGVILNYPVKIFDTLKYIAAEERAEAAPSIGANDHLKDDFSLYNSQTLGLRLDTAKEISYFDKQSNKKSIKEKEEVEKISNFFEYTKALMYAMQSVQEQIHLSPEDWARTMHIDILTVKTVDFNMTREMKAKLVEQGNKGAEAFFNDASKNKPYCNVVG